MDWLATCKLASKHLGAGVGGHFRDRPQVVYGLLCNRDCCPVAVRAFQGNTPDPNTLAEQGADLRRRKMGQQFQWKFYDETQSFSSARKLESIRAGQRLDGLYVIRTNLTEETLGDDEAVRAYKSLARVERSFRSLKTVVLKVRPLFSWRERRVRAHLFVCLLANYLEWHMRRRRASRTCSGA